MYNNHGKWTGAIMTVEEVAYRSNKSIKTIRRQIAGGNLKASKLSNRYLISDEDFNYWFANYQNDKQLESIFDDVNYCNKESKKVN